PRPPSSPATSIRFCNTNQYVLYQQLLVGLCLFSGIVVLKRSVDQEIFASNSQDKFTQMPCSVLLSSGRLNVMDQRCVAYCAVCVTRNATIFGVNTFKH
ncbi:hypothetical protein CU097_003931, partial [Rhizopus azygosporus]